NGLASDGDLVAGYLRINRELRVATEKRVRELCRESAAEPLWEGAFLRLPDSAPLSGFADRRTYVYRGQAIDHQTHLGFDLASLRGSPVPAGNTGRVVFAGPLGIYGNAVILDHGLGLFSLYGHLSEVTVTAGTTLHRGDVLGKTGDTGLAGGDHLHFSVMIHGVHVDPVEWWDAHWIHDHVETRPAAVELEGLVSAVDGRGDRILWLMRPLATGTLLVAAQVNEPAGLRDLQVVDVGRKQLRTTRQRIESEGLRLVAASWRVLDALLVEAQERAGTAEPGHDYLRVRPRLTTEPPAPPAEPVSSHAQPPGGAEEAAA